jgi:hypothetical protein
LVFREDEGAVAHHAITAAGGVAGIPQIHGAVPQAALLRHPQESANWLAAACPVGVEFLPVQRLDGAGRLAVGLLRRPIVVEVTQVRADDDAGFPAAPSVGQRPGITPPQRGHVPWEVILYSWIKQPQRAIRVSPPPGQRVFSHSPTRPGALPA